MQTNCRGLPYEDVKTMAKQAYELFNDLFEFQEVHVYDDINKASMIERLNNIS